MNKLWRDHLTSSVICRGLVVALIVGPILAAINHADKFAQGELTQTDVIKIAITFAVPFTVSCVSSVLSNREKQRKKVE